MTDPLLIRVTFVGFVLGEVSAHDIPDATSDVNEWSLLALK